MIDAEKYVEMANTNRAKMDRSMGPVERIVRDHDVVLGVFDDPTESEGVGFLRHQGDKAVGSHSRRRPSFWGLSAAFQGCSAQGVRHPVSVRLAGRSRAAGAEVRLMVGGFAGDAGERPYGAPGSLNHSSLGDHQALTTGMSSQLVV